MSESFEKKQDSVYSKRLKAGKRRTYFFDIRATRGNDFFLTITESRKRPTDDGYDRHKIFLYKEDFHKFIKGLNEAVDYVKTELMPNFDFDAFNHATGEEAGGINTMYTTQKPVIAADTLNNDPLEKLPVTEGQVTDGLLSQNTIAKQDIIDGAERPDSNSDVSKPTTGEEKIVNTNHTEEVDRW